MQPAKTVTRAEQIDLVTDGDWCGMWEGGTSVCVFVHTSMCRGMFDSPPSEPENTQVEEVKKM